MTEKQKIFADEYLIDLNATRAYRVAYPSVKKEEAAAVNGSKLLRNTKVAAYIQERMQEPWMCIKSISTAADHFRNGSRIRRRKLKMS